MAVPATSHAASATSATTSMRTERAIGGSVDQQGQARQVPLLSRAPTWCEWREGRSRIGQGASGLDWVQMAEMQ
jgi:hypothetical protein